jgi:Xaa-Pro aminopeptidase
MPQQLKGNYFTNRIPDREYAGRIQKIRRQMDLEGVTIGLAYATEHMPGDVQYLTGYDPHLENVALLVTQDRLIALGGAEGARMFEDSARLGEWRNLTLFEIPFQDYGATKFWTLNEIFGVLFGGFPQEIGLLSARNVLSAEILDLFQQSVTGVRFRDISYLLAEARYEKSPAELEMYRISSDIATEAMKSLLENIRPGLRELELACHADFVMKKLGAYGFGFDTMVCSGPRINTIIGRSTNRVLQEGELVLLGVSPRYEGYTSALGRTVVAGRATDDQIEFLDRGIAAYELAAKKLIVGGPARSIDLAAREYLKNKDLGQYHAYGVGHGIGFTECLEGKTATSSSEYDLPAGIAIMVDVGLFGVPKYFGARHENPHLIDHDGKSECLTDLPMKVHG